MKNFNQQIQEAYQKGYQQALNEQPFGGSPIPSAAMAPNPHTITTALPRHGGVARGAEGEGAPKPPVLQWEDPCGDVNTGGQMYMHCHMSRLCDGNKNNYACAWLECFNDPACNIYGEQLVYE